MSTTTDRVAGTWLEFVARSFEPKLCLWYLVIPEPVRALHRMKATIPTFDLDGKNLTARNLCLGKGSRI